MRKKSLLLLSLILLICLFLRLFKLNELFYFTMDEELIAFRSWGLFILKRPFLIGAASPLQFHLPPYFFYLSALFLVPFKFNPAGWGVTAALIGVLTAYFLFRLVVKIFGKKIAILSALFYSVSFTAVFFDRHYWPMSLSPLLIILALLLLTKKRSGLGLAGILTLGLSADPSNIPLALTIMFAKIKSKITTLVVFLVLFLTPLILFDLRHQWTNFLGISRFFSTTSNHQFALSNVVNALLLLPRSLARFWFSPQTDLLQLHGYCIPFAQARQKNLSMILVILAIILLIWFIRQGLKSKSSILKAIACLLIFYLLGMTIFGALGFSLFDHYFTGLLPIFALITVLVISKLPKFFQLILVILFVTVNLWQITKVQNPYGLKAKQDLVVWANQQLTGQPFALDSVSKCHRENGLRYLFETSNNPPTISFIDPNFAWLYQQPPATVMPDKVLLVTDKTILPSQPVINSAQFGAMKAYILDNALKTYEFSY